MKNTILFLALLFASATAFAQNNNDATAAQQTTEKLTALYQLDAAQQVKMLEIQARIQRNLAEIQDLKTTAPLQYTQKIDAMQYANLGHMRQLLDEAQLRVFQEKEKSLRVQKAEVYKEMKAAGKHPTEIEMKMAELGETALTQR